MLSPAVIPASGVTHPGLANCSPLFAGRLRLCVGFIRQLPGRLLLCHDVRVSACSECNVLAAWRFLELDDSYAALLFGTSIRSGIRH